MIKEILGKHVAATSRTFTGREKSVGASEIGMCARRVHFTKKSDPRDKDYVDRWGAYHRGTLIEDAFWQPAMKREFGDDLIWSGPDQKTLSYKELSATPDGLVINQPRDRLKELGCEDIGEDGCFVVECKSIDPRVDLKREKEEHSFQVQVQMGLIRQLTEHKPEVALISYIDAAWMDNVSEFVVPYNPKSYTAAKARAEMILTAQSADDVPPEGLIAGGFECKVCPFVARCGAVRRNMPDKVIEDIDPGARQEVIDLCRQANRLKEKERQNGRELTAVQEDIKKSLKKVGTRKIEDVVTWTQVRGRTTLDDKAVREVLEASGLNPEVYSKTGEPSDRLNINPNI